MVPRKGRTSRTTYRRIVHCEKRLQVLLQIRINAHQRLQNGHRWHWLVRRLGDDFAMKLVLAVKCLTCSKSRGMNQMVAKSLPVGNGQHMDAPFAAPEHQEEDRKAVGCVDHRRHCDG